MKKNSPFFVDSKLPPPMNKDEADFYFQQKLNGDPEVRDYIITRNIRLVKIIVHSRFGNTPYEEEELVSVGLIGLIKSVDTFNVSKNYAFGTYAEKCITNEILMFMRREKRHNVVQSLDTPTDRDKDGNETLLGDRLEDPTNPILACEEKFIWKEIRRIVSNLSERDRKVILLYFGFYNDKCYTTWEIAQMLGITQTYVSRLIRKSLKKIAEKLKEKGIIEIESVRKKKINRTIHFQSLYEYLAGYSKEQIDEVISNLKDEEKNLIKLRYGDDLASPVTSELWTSEASEKFYGSVAPRMKRLLAKLEGKRKETENTNEVKNTDKTEPEKVGYIKALQLTTTPTQNKFTR